jgi:miniconductance mechanosensitive channel
MNMHDQVLTWLIDHGVNGELAAWLSWLILAAAVIILAALANFAAKRILLAAVSQFVKRSRTKWDDILLERRVFARLSHLAPAIVIYMSAYLFPPLSDAIQRLSMVYMILAGLYAFTSFLNAIVDIYNTYEISRQRPIKGYVEIFKILLVVFVGIIGIATVLNQSPWKLLTGLGAMTAIIILVFRDSILGLVASVQLSTHDMVRIGDWIEVPKYGADGNVIDVTLHTVKVQNWDKTISTIPAYQLIADSFKNWRGMSESGGRRIKRAINIDMSSIKFCTEEMLNRYEKYQLIADYIRERREEIHTFNEAHDVDTSQLVNGRNMTNVGTFRAYVIAYLKNHPKIHQHMTFLVRQLQPTETGLPIEIYVFSNDQVWANYEAIQADIFDHILAVVPLFDLQVFQNPSGQDIKGVKHSLNLA